MTFQKQYNIIRQNMVFYLMGFLIIFGIKYFYSGAGSDSLIWILAPTTKWVSLLSGIPFTYEPGVGYVNHSLRFLIAPSCSGVQFMLITMATLIFSFVHRLGAWQEDLPARSSRHWKSGVCWIVVSMTASYLLTIFVNGLRIIVAIYLPVYFREWNLFGSLLTPERLHTIIGTVVYFISLLTIHHLAGYLIGRVSGIGKNTVSQSLLRKCMPPVFWYFFIVLGIPFLNRAYQNGREKFMEYAILILFSCVPVLFLYIGVSILRKQRETDSVFH